MQEVEYGKRATFWRGSDSECEKPAGHTDLESVPCGTVISVGPDSGTVLAGARARHIFSHPGRTPETGHSDSDKKRKIVQNSIMANFLNPPTPHPTPQKTHLLCCSAKATWGTKLQQATASGTQPLQMPQHDWLGTLRRMPCTSGKRRTIHCS